MGESCPEDKQTRERNINHVVYYLYNIVYRKFCFLFFSKIIRKYCDGVLMYLISSAVENLRLMSEEGMQKIS